MANLTSIFKNDKTALKMTVCDVFSKRSLWSVEFLPAFPDLEPKNCLLVRDVQR